MDKKPYKEQLEDSNKEEWMTVTEALHKAKTAFYKSLEDKGYDGAYWALGIDIFFLSSDFTDVLEGISWDNLQYKIDNMDDD